MKYNFPSEEWVFKYRDAINSNPEYKITGAGWDKGAVSFICIKNPSIGLLEDTGIWLDLHKGECREAKIVTPEEAMKSPFCISGEYARWKQVIKKEIDPIKAMMQGKLKLKGDLRIIVRYVDASKTLVECAGRVPTQFLDE